MDKQYNLAEIFDIAIQIEINGAGFYREVAAKQSIPAVKAFLLDLADQEDGHEQLFRKMQNRFADNSDVDALNDEFAMLYMQTEASNYVFKSENMPTTVADMLLRDVLKLAMERERDSILFFMGLKFLMRKSADKEVINNLIEEEQFHLATLAQFSKEYGLEH
ncbi:MAG: ferritin family protein [Victivallaceae bacterium]|nr:ferritin family protein [Victivallaceae bacterium]